MEVPGDSITSAGMARFRQRTTAASGKKGFTMSEMTMSSRQERPRAKLCAQMSDREFNSRTNLRHFVFRVSLSSRPFTTVQDIGILMMICPGGSERPTDSKGHMSQGAHIFYAVFSTRADARYLRFRPESRRELKADPCAP